MATQVQAQAASPVAYSSLDQIVAAVAAGKLNVDTASALLQKLQRSAPKALTANTTHETPPDAFKGAAALCAQGAHRQGQR